MNVKEMEARFRETKDREWEIYCRHCAVRGHGGQPMGDGRSIHINPLSGYRQHYHMSIYYRNELRRLISDLKRSHYAFYGDWRVNRRNKIKPDDVIRKLGHIHRLRPYHLHTQEQANKWLDMLLKRPTEYDRSVQLPHILSGKGVLQLRRYLKQYE